MKGRAKLAPFATVVALFVTRSANAQNADQFFFGDEAALSAGAVVASGSDSGALWYNPAGFGTLKRSSVSASASTFGIRIRTIPKALVTADGVIRQELDLASADVISIPNAVVLATQLGSRFALAAGLLTTGRDIREASDNIDPQTFTQGAGSVVAEQRIEVLRDSSKYHAGAAFAAKLTDSLRLGGGLFLTYLKETRTLNYSIRTANAANAAQAAFATSNIRATGSLIGTMMQVGAQYDVTERLSIGLTLRSPEVAITSSAQGSIVVSQANFIANPPTGRYANQSPKAESAAGHVANPARVLLGVAYWLGPKSWVEVGIDAAHGLPDNKASSPQQVQVNARAGVRYMLAPEWIVGGGLFSDRATLARLDNFPTTDRVDYYGFTAGVSKRTPLALATAPWPEALVLVTTFSLRASLGFGDARTIVIGDDAPNRDDPTSSVTYVELMPYLASSVLF